MQPIIARWTNPPHDTEGNPYTEADHSHYLLTINNGQPIQLPLTWGTNFDLGTLPEVQALPSGTHKATIAVRTKKGVVGQMATATFSVNPTPVAPGNFSITTG